MKRSELKSYIKEQIFSTLESSVSENLEDRQRLASILKELDDLSAEAAEIFADEFPNEVRSADAYDIFSFGRSSNPRDTTFTSTLEELGVELQEDVNIDSNDPRVADKVSKIKRQTPDANINVVDMSEQVDDDETDKAATKGAKKATSKSKRLDAKIKALKDIEADMKSILNKYKKAEGEDKNKFKDQLKSKTALKKETQKEIDRLEREMV